jgi:hypothetical protein
MGCFSNKKKRKSILLTNESNITIHEKNENIKVEKPKLEKKNTETKPNNYSKLGSLRFNSNSYVNPFPKLFLDKKEDEKVLNTNRNNHIIHLVKSLNKNANLKEKENYDKIREYINWTLSKNINGENIWINNGKITLSKNEIEKIINTPEEKIKNESFLKRRIWVNNYIQQVISDQIVDNPVLVVSRNNILEDSLNQFKTNKEIDLKRPLHVFFLDEDSNDIKGMYREWFSCVFKEFFSGKLFKENNFESLGRNTIIINDDFICNKEDLEYYELFGKLVAKSLVDRVILNENLNYILLKQLMHLKIDYEDIKYIDMDYYISFKELIKAENIEQSDNLTFCWLLKNNITGELDEIELIPNGKKIYINNENKYFFLEKFVEYYTYLRHKEKIDSILKGFNSLIPSDKLNIFSVEEFDLLLSGQIKIDIIDWKNNTEYIGYSPNDNIIKWFWDSLLNLKPFQLKIFFTFCTGMARAPLNGFRVLQTSRNQIVKFCIEKVNNNNDLIQAKTCFNKILLPCYESYEKMKENIYKIVNNDTNFLGRK